MNDKELLELAAKACGWRIKRFREMLHFCAFVEDEAGNPVNTGWNPLADDGDALRLAVKLRLDVRFQQDGDDGYVDAGSCDAWTVYLLDTGGDLASATRRSVVKAAAAIGKTIP